MIFTERTVTVRNGDATINASVILYRGDRKVEIRFSIVDAKFKFQSSSNIISSTNAAFAQLAILNPNGSNAFTDITATDNGTVLFVITEEMIDQLEEVGTYAFHIRLFDEDLESRITLPEVKNGFEVREPIATEDRDNSVNNAIVGYAMLNEADDLTEEVPDTFDSDGDYNKTIWATGDKITEGKLNKIEDALDTINQNEINDKNALNKQMTSNFNVMQNQIDNLVLESGGDSNLEVVQARGNFDTLNDRLNDFDNYPFSKTATLPKFEKNLIKFISIRNVDLTDRFYISNTRKNTSNGERQLTIRNLSSSIVLNYTATNPTDDNGEYISPTSIEKITITSNNVECNVVVDWAIDVTEKNNWTIAETELSDLCKVGFDNLEIVEARENYPDLNSRLNDFTLYPFAIDTTLNNIYKNSFVMISLVNADLNDRFYVSQLRKVNGANERRVTIKNIDESIVFSFGGNNGETTPTGFEVFTKTVNNVTIYIVINWDTYCYERDDYTINDTEISKQCYINIPTEATSKLIGKKLISLGDSIMYGAGNDDIGIADLIANKYGMEHEKLSMSGSTMADCDGRGVIYKQIDNATMIDPDFIIINGGYNDVNNTDEIGLGEIYSLKGTTSPDDECYSDFDTSTFSGALETLMMKITELYPEAKVIFITTPKIGNTFYYRTDDSMPYTYVEVHERTLECCKKWGISYVDLFSESRLTTGYQLRSIYSQYIPDNVHPNELGYNKFYLPLIISKMESLIYE